jgi:hypothetical protein
VLDPRAVRLDGSNAQHEPLGDLVIGVTEGDQADDLTLAPGQAVVLATPLGVARCDAHGAHEPWPRIPSGGQHNRRLRRGPPQRGQRAESLVMGEVDVEHEHAWAQGPHRLLGFA